MPRLDTSAYIDTVWQAISCHRLQLRDLEKLQRLSARQKQTIVGEQSLYRAYSPVKGGSRTETDLFEGLR